MDKPSVKDTVKQIITYVEDHIHDTILLDDIAREVYLSKYHLHRLFTSVTDKPLMRYIRERKLSSSIHELLTTDLKIIDIAGIYNFKSEQSYIRAFRNLFDITPSKYRRSYMPIPIVPKMDLFEFEEFREGMLLQPEFKYYPEFQLVGHGSKVDFRQDIILNERGNKQAVDFYVNYRHLIKHSAETDSYFGVSLINDNVKECCYYLSAVRVTSLEDIPPGMVSMVLPSCQYAVFKYIALKKPQDILYSDLKEIYSFIQNRWLCHTNYKRKHYEFEYVNPRDLKEDFSLIQIHIPIITIEEEEGEQLKETPKQ